MSGKGKQSGDHGTRSASELRTGTARKEDQLNTGSSLLNFMNLASGNVKTALEKPANFKRNINHRRYLQKQLRNYAKRNTDAPLKKSSPKMKSHQNANEKHSYKTPSIAYMKSLANAWLPDFSQSLKEAYMDKDRNALKERNFPATFWQEPIFPSNVSQEYSNAYGYQQQQANADESLHNTAAIETFLDGWNEYDTKEFSPQSTQSDSIPSITSENGTSEEFMTGEELTRNLDIKDLYVPELYSADRLLNDVQETLYAGQISPSQYFLSSPSSYNDQGYLNFSFEHDPQGLPPFAMAFLSPGSLTHY